MTIEARLRDELTDDRYALPAWPDAVDRVLDGMARRRRRRVLVGVAVATTVIAVATPTAVTMTAAPLPQPVPATPGRDGVVPWRPDPRTGPPVGVLMPPGPDATPPVDPAPCDPAHLQYSEVYDGGSVSSRRVTTVELRNGGTGRCRLASRTELVATTHGVRTGVVPTEAGYFARLPDTRSRADLEPGEVARLDITTATGCNGGLNAEVYTGLSLRVGGRPFPLTVVQQLESSCPVSLSEWYRVVPDIGDMTAPPYSGLGGELVVAAPVRRGTDLDFIVTLTNRTTGDIRFEEPCPLLRMQLWTAGEWHVLNCVGVAPVAAGGSVTFAMRLAIPTGTPTGLAILRWGLAGRYGPMTAVAETPVVIE